MLYNSVGEVQEVNTFLQALEKGTKLDVGSKRSSPRNGIGPGPPILFYSIHSPKMVIK